MLRVLQVFTITVPPGQVEAAQRFVQQQLTSQARLTYSVGGTMKYELPTAEVRRLMSSVSLLSDAIERTVGCRVLSGSPPAKYAAYVFQAHG
jgi:hypothetical protein